MTHGRWDALSNWHNAWLSAPATERVRLRAELGTHAAAVVRSTVDERRGVFLGRLDGSPEEAPTPLFRSDSPAAFVTTGKGTGALVYLAQGTLQLRPIDPATGVLLDEARSLGIPAAAMTPYQGAMFAVSSDALVTATSVVPFERQLASISRRGDGLRISEDRALLYWVRLSPDGGRVALQRIDWTRGNPDLWIENLKRGTHIRITSSMFSDQVPVWSPDGRWLAFATGPRNKMGVSIAPSDGSGTPRTLPCPTNYCEPTDWSHDGRVLLANVRTDQGGDIWNIPVDGSPPQPLLISSSSERDARLSANGRWIAYVSDESGQPQVSLRSISGPPRRVLVADAAEQPVWRKDGAELFYRTLTGALRRVVIGWPADGSVPVVRAPREIPAPPFATAHWGTDYDVSPDGERIYFLKMVDLPLPREVAVTLGWRALLESADGR